MHHPAALAWESRVIPLVSLPPACGSQGDVGSLSWWGHRDLVGLEGCLTKGRDVGHQCKPQLQEALVSPGISTIHCPHQPSHNLISGVKSGFPTPELSGFCLSKLQSG